jgi:hypothetical protein
VHGEQLVVLLVGEKLQPRTGQLRPHHQRHHAGEQEEDERRDQVEVSDHLVVGGRQPGDGDRTALTPLRRSFGQRTAEQDHERLP